MKTKTQNTKTNLFDLIYLIKSTSCNNNIYYKPLKTKIMNNYKITNLTSGARHFLNEEEKQIFFTKNCYQSKQEQ